MSKLQVIFLTISLVISGCAEEVNEKISDDSFQQTYWVEDYTKDLNFPWAITWLPNGDLLVTERLGKIKLIPGSFASLATTFFLFFLFHVFNISPNFFIYVVIRNYVY